MTQDPYHVGYYAVEKAIQILNGETVDPEYDVGFFSGMMHQQLIHLKSFQ